MEDKKRDSSEACGEHCLYGYGHKHMTIRLVLGLIIIFSVFALGMLIGEIKGSLRSEYNYGFRGRMMQYGDYGYGDYGYPTMMRGYWSNSATQTAPSASEAPAPVKK